jgi:hypothetical protein
MLGQRLHSTGERSKSDVGNGGKMQKAEACSLKKKWFQPMFYQRARTVHAD